MRTTPTPHRWRRSARRVDGTGRAPSRQGLYCFSPHALNNEAFVPTSIRAEDDVGPEEQTSHLELAEDLVRQRAQAADDHVGEDAACSS